MKLGFIVFVVLIYNFSPAECTFGETDNIRVFDPAVKMPRARLRALLREADLVSAGFTKTEETQIVTGEDGKKVTKEVTYYTVKDSCSNVSYWEGIIHERLPTFSEALTRKVISEVDQRIGGRATEYCRFGLEIHYRLCGHVEKPKWVKRGRPSSAQSLSSQNCNGYCTCCGTCGKVEIKYRL